MNKVSKRKLEATALRNHINAAGGLVGQGDLAREWAVSRTRVQEIVEDDTFPDPVATVGTERQERRLWAWEQCQEWRDQYHGVRRKPPKAVRERVTP